MEGLSPMMQRFVERTIDSMVVIIYRGNESFEFPLTRVLEEDLVSASTEKLRALQRAKYGFPTAVPRR